MFLHLSCKELKMFWKVCEERKIEKALLKEGYVMSPLLEYHFANGPLHFPILVFTVVLYVFLYFIYVSKTWNNFSPFLSLALFCCVLVMFPFQLSLSLFISLLTFFVLPFSLLLCDISFIFIGKIVRFVARWLVRLTCSSFDFWVLERSNLESYWITVKRQMLHWTFFIFTLRIQNRSNDAR